MRYRLDDLGWYHFELLVQSLLKAELGLGVESWGGTSDGGRDAYSGGPLSFPDPNSLQPGPFLFQVKFISGANAAGSRPRGPFIQAVESECKKIKTRLESSSWLQPAHYVLITNAPLSPGLRTDAERRLSVVLPTARIHCLGALDICDLLDKHKAIARSFPELLSLRDLDLLLEEVVSRLILERSTAAIGEAQDIVPKFVATKAYWRSWQILERHRFLVLDGPPEMGKTAIARMISIVKLLEGWEAIDCRSSDDFFQLYKREANQIFIVDDAFGRTEYDVTLGRRWERDLSKVLFKLNASHWLILTSRKHILARALRDLDMTGIPHSFPDPGELVVAAEFLSIEEKARILYRHLRKAGLSSLTKSIVRREARFIVENAHFTPFRIQFLANEVLPGIEAAGLTGKKVKNEIDEAIRNPTDRMRKAFRKLPNEHQSVLITILDLPGLAWVWDLQKKFEDTCVAVSKLAFAEIIEDLDGTFLRSRGSRVDWIHPSYRDLIIEELARDIPRQRKFIAKASPAGLRLAISEAGGQSGLRRFPLMSSEECWKDLQNRAIEIVRQGSPQIGGELIDSFCATLGKGLPEGLKDRMKSQIALLCGELEKAWHNSGLSIDPEPLRSYVKACAVIGQEPRLPNFQSVWETHLLDLKKTTEDGYILDINVVDRWCVLVDLIESHLPSFFESPFWQESYQEGLSVLAEAVRKETSSSISGDPDVYSSQASNLEQLGDWLYNLPPAGGVTEEILEQLSAICHGEAEYYRSLSRERSEDGGYSRSSLDFLERAFNVEALFEDL